MNRLAKSDLLPGYRPIRLPKASNSVPVGFIKTEKKATV